MLDTADVLGGRHPVAHGLLVERAVLVVRRAVAQEVPRRVDERVHRVGVALPRAATVGALDVDPLLGRGQRRDALRLQLGAVQLGQLHGQLVVRHTYLAARVAVDDRDRGSPIALTGQQPVAQPEVDGAPAQTLGLQPLDDRRLRVGHVQAVQRDLVVGRVDRRPRAGVGLTLEVGRRLHGAHDRQVERLGELPVPLVLPGHGHDRPGAVVGQHVVGRVDGQLPAGDRVGCVHAQEDTGLGPIGRQPFDVGGLPHFLDVRRQGGSLLVGDQVSRPAWRRRPPRRTWRRTGCPAGS